MGTATSLRLSAVCKECMLTLTLTLAHARVSLPCRSKWWHLNRHHFELGLVLKVVVLHLLTEAVRHKTAKPCSDRFWIMLVGMTGGCG
jgi:hypothetical protein